MYMQWSKSPEELEQHISEEDSRKCQAFDEQFLASGRFLTEVPPGDEIVISGLSGVYPDSRNVRHFEYNLMNNVDMVSPDDRRWSLVHPEIPKRCGKIFDVEKFDAGYFGLHYRQSNATDPSVRLNLERAVEAVMDAAVNPDDLKGSNTGVFVGACFSESDKTWFLEKLYPQHFAITGLERSMMAHRISYFLKLNGPSFTVDTACSSSLYAVEHAYRAIRSGKCDRAIVGCANLCLHPFVSLQFARLGVLSKDGACKVFDANSDGYARSETIAAIFLQKASEAKRSYAQVVHARTNCDGYKEQGITFPSSAAQKQLLQEFYQECNVDPSTLSYLEAHGTGTKVGDPEEVEAIDGVFTKGRSTPLLLGSVKSNIGHSEPSSGLCSITKVILGMETGLIPPNMNFTRPREGLEALEKGRLKVVTEPTPFQDDRGLVGINSFGFGGGNCHVLLRWNEKKKQNRSEPIDDLPRLVPISGRTSEAINSIADDLRDRSIDAEFIRLYHDLFGRTIQGHLFRGFTIVSKSGELDRSFKSIMKGKKSIYLIFSDFGPRWTEFARKLFILPIFAQTIQKINAILASRKVSLKDMIVNGQKGEASSVFAQILGNVSVQIALCDVIKRLQLTIDGYLGYGVTELVCGYYSDCLSLEEAILGAYEIACAVRDFNSNPDCDSPEDIQRKLAKMKPALMKNLKSVILGAKARPLQWITPIEVPTITSDYFVIALNLVVNTSDLTRNLPLGSVILDLGPGYVEICNDNDLTLLSMAEADKSDAFTVLLKNLGRLYEFGATFKTEVLYPEIKFPVSRGTPMISPVIKWDHSKDWFVTYYTADDTLKTGEKKMSVTPKEDNWAFLNGHMIDGRCLFPATGYLYIVWEVLGLITGMLTSDMNVIFEDCKFLRATPLSKEVKTDLIVMIQRGTGNFEVIDGDEACASGRILISRNEQPLELPLPVVPPKKDLIDMGTKDVYKELKLRGYGYKGLFRKFRTCDVSATRSTLHWDGNWIAFMDSLLQMRILQTDSRGLYVPIGIKRLAVDAKAHIAYAQNFGENPDLPAYFYKECDLLKCGAIEIKGLLAAPIPRRKFRGEPVLETYKFVPNSADNLTLDQVIRIDVQLMLENLPALKVKVVELIDEASENVEDVLSSKILDALGDLPLVRPEITVLCKEAMEIANLTVENGTLVSHTDCHLVVGSKILQRGIVLNQAISALKANAVVLSREPLDFVVPNDSKDLTVLTVYTTVNEKLVLFRKTCEYNLPEFIDVGDADFNWLSDVQKSVKDSHPNVVLYSRNEPMSGVLGLGNCLRREPGATNVKSLFVLGDLPEIDARNPFYESQLKKNLAVNVYKDGAWGTYRHLLIESEPEIDSEHCYVNVTTRGDLSSLRWIEGPLTADTQLAPEESLVHIYFAALNFRDIMTASGKISADVVTRDRTKQEIVQGFEYAGRTKQGKRVFGMVMTGALSNMVAADNHMMWNVPDEWSLEDAATVSVVYGTVLHALVTIASIKRGDSLLIHAGSGGIGQAAIQIGLFFGCAIYTTVGTPEKREYIKKRFPQLKDHQIGNSRDCSFEHMIHKQTDGRGVDIVLNSLAEEKLQASVRCLAKGGRFLEIGKFDLANNNTLHLLFLEKGASFHGIMLDYLFNEEPHAKFMLRNLMTTMLDAGAVKPLPRTIFKEDEIEQAFRFMAGGKHMGKVLIQVRKEEQDKMAIPGSRIMKGLCRFYCDPEKVYIICGGLGGFGLELADWLVLRGARNLVLTSRNGIKNGYQSYRINIWRDYGAAVLLPTHDITTKKGCEDLIRDAGSLGTIDGIFNLAVVLKDALLENQTVENFKISLGPKAHATKYLDEVSRVHCPDLRTFVVFSSVSCGRGNAGQMNYGMANSIMERICEKRKSDGYPALAVEWGAVGDVGLVADMQEMDTELEIGGTLQQRISNCLEVFDLLLKQESPIVASMVVAEKRRGGGGADNIVDAVANIIGIRDIKTVSMHSTLPELGMDSMSAVEIKQTLEREFDVFLTPQDMRNLTFSRLIEIQEEKSSETGTGQKVERPITGFEMMLRYVNDEVTSHIPYVNLKSNLSDDASDNEVILFPGMEGAAKAMQPLAGNLTAKVYCLQIPYDDPPEQVEQIAALLLPSIRKLVRDKSKPFVFLAHSYGVVLAMEIVSILEQDGFLGTLICVDGSPYMLRALLKGTLDVASESHFQTGFLCQLLSLHVTFEVILKNKDRLANCSTFEERLSACEEFCTNDTAYSIQHWKKIARATFTRLRALDRYHPTYSKLNSKLKLVKPEKMSVANLDEDYRLSDLCTSPVEVVTLPGNHVTVLEGEPIAELIHRVLGVAPPPVYTKETILKDGAGFIEMPQQEEIKQI